MRFKFVLNNLFPMLYWWFRKRDKPIQVNFIVIRWSIRYDYKIKLTFLIDFFFFFFFFIPLHQNSILKILTSPNISILSYFWPIPPSICSMKKNRPVVKKTYLWINCDILTINNWSSINIHKKSLMIILFL